MPLFQKKTNSPKYVRLEQIYERLLKTPTGVTISELSEELDVSTKTIQRDLYEVLADLGAVKEGRVWKINPLAAQDSLGAKERIVLGILDEMAKSGGRSFYTKAHALLAQVSQQLEHPIFTSINSELLEESSITLFESLEEAIKKSLLVSYKYSNGSFYVKPLKLVFFDGFWYLLALDTKKNDMFKKFHLKSIKNLQLTQTTFNTPLQLEERLRHANSIWFNLDEPFDVELIVSKEIRKYFERKPLRRQSIIGEEKDGSLILSVSITHELEIIPTIFWFIPHIKVLHPQWLADAVKEKVQKYVAELC